MRSDVRWAVVAATVALVAALAGLAVPATYGARTTADEPHYLLTALSLAEDGDVDIADELADERWRSFHRVELPLQERVLADGRMVSPHDPLLPVLLVPGVALGGWVGAKIVLALLAAATAGATVLLATRRLAVAAPLAGVVTAVAFASWPLAAHATQVYPEMAAGLAVVLGTGAVTARRLHLRHVVVLVLAVVALPWLAVKYAPVAAALAAAALWRLRSRPRVVAATVAVLAVAGVVYLVVHQVVWTGWTVYASADHFVERGEFSVVGFAPDPIGRSRRLVGLLLGRDFGLVVWQPAFLVVPAGVAVGLRDRVGRVLVLVAAAGWLTATFVALTMQGWWVPGRQVVLVLPLLVVLVATWLDRSPRPWAVPVTAVLGALGLVTGGWLVVDGLSGALTWVVDFASVGDPLHGLRRAVLPDYLRVTGRTWALQAAWTCALGALAWLGWRDGDPVRSRRA
ncbi:hypothetical protein [Salsipaludibacter albus]|uniref:hypothetical protein n=1 Tax=Salsipaludibacter albus TaxID=2849650 RepID=UPI001EE41A45|nr:hypothetical protein [Salsipaludibacter albus]MBY5161728.1 hypothetical protein [Salsipaludibacter albus]